MTDVKQKSFTELFLKLTELGCFGENDIYETSDGFSAAAVSVADILARKGIDTVPGKNGNEFECRLFFDDWYLYAVRREQRVTYSLFKMREQEYDAREGRNADGDMPGVTVSFIALRENILLECLTEPTHENKASLNDELNRVAAYRGQRHSKELKEYFIRTCSKGAYLVAKMYTEYIASLAKDGFISVPERYTADCEKRGTHGRVMRFIEENNASAEKTVCDHKKIYICDPTNPTGWERLAIMATHTGNTSVYSFAAEVQFHAKFLTRWAMIPIPIIGRSPYDSAIRADMSIGDGEFTGPTPYYRATSRIVKKQYLCHKGIGWAENYKKI